VERSRNRRSRSDCSTSKPNGIFGIPGGRGEPRSELIADLRGADADLAAVHGVEIDLDEPGDLAVAGGQPQPAAAQQEAILV
jgi:hypothetical protein